MATLQATGPAGRTRRLLTLKRRAEFLSVRKGARFATTTLVLEARRRGEQGGSEEKQARFGFTVTKQIGGAVERNRIRRRLKAAVRGLEKDHARADFDYVLIARRPAIDCAFGVLERDLAAALERIHATPRQGPRARKAHK